MIACLPAFGFLFLTLACFLSHTAASLDISPSSLVYPSHSFYLFAHSIIARTNLRPKSNKIFYVFILVSKYFVTKMISKGLDVALQLQHTLTRKHIHPLVMEFVFKLNWVDKMNCLPHSTLRLLLLLYMLYILLLLYYYTYYERKQNRYAWFLSTRLLTHTQSATILLVFYVTNNGST